MNKLFFVVTLLFFMLGCSEDEKVTLSSTSDRNQRNTVEEFDTTATISARGSIFANGMRFTGIESAEILFEGESLDSFSEENLSSGMIVDISGEYSIDENNNIVKAIAKSINYSEGIVGKIDSIDTLNQYITILGKTVFYDESTSFYGIDIFSDMIDFSEDIVVSVNATLDVDGDLIATRIARKPDNEEIKISGVISSISEADKILNVMGLKIDYSAIASIFPNDIVSGYYFKAGDKVKVKGVISNEDQDQPYQFKAESIRSINRKSNYSNSNKKHKGCDGFVENIFTGNSETMSYIITKGKQFNIDDNTKISGGSFRDITKNSRIKIRGKLEEKDNRSYRASYIHIIKPLELSAEGYITDVKDVTLTSDYELEVTLNNGFYTFMIGKNTKLVDKSNADTDFAGTFSKESLKAGDFVSVSSAKINNTLVAGKLVRSKFEQLESSYISSKKGFASIELDSDIKRHIKLKGKVSGLDKQKNFLYLNKNNEIYIADSTTIISDIGHVISVEDFYKLVSEKSDLSSEVHVAVYGDVSEPDYKRIFADRIVLSRFKRKHKPQDSDFDVDNNLRQKKPFAFFGFLQKIVFEPQRKIIVASKSCRNKSLCRLVKEIYLDMNLDSSDKSLYKEDQDKHANEFGLQFLSKDSSVVYNLDQLMSDFVGILEQDNLFLPVEIKGYQLGRDRFLAKSITIFDEDLSIYDDSYSIMPVKEGSAATDNNNYIPKAKPQKIMPFSRHKSKKPSSIKEKSFKSNAKSISNKSY